MSRQPQARALSGSPVAVGPGTAFVRRQSERVPARHASPADVMADLPHGPCECRIDAAHSNGCYGPAAWEIGWPGDRYRVCSVCTGPDDMAEAVLLVRVDELDAFALYDSLGAHVMRRRRAARRAS